MKKSSLKLLTVLGALVTSVALIGGGTMAWFTASKEAAPATFTAGTVKIQAGQTVADTADTRYYKDVGPLEGQSFTDGINYHQGPKMNGKPITDSDRKKPTSVLDKGGKFFSLGKAGWIIVQLSEPISKGDVVVIETTNDNAKKNYVETADVFVSTDGSDWTLAGVASNQYFPSGDYHPSSIASPMAGVRFVKLVDTTQPTVEINGQTVPNASDDAYDVDYIYAQNILDEENWNPGDTNKTAFFVSNIGTKDIVVRAKLEGHWETLQNGQWTAVSPQPDPSRVKITVDGTGWFQGSDGNYYYGTGPSSYTGLKGTYGGETEAAQQLGGGAELKLKVALSGAADNSFQGRRYVLTPTFQAVQNSHQDGWTWDSALAQ